LICDRLARRPVTELLGTTGRRQIVLVVVVVVVFSADTR
jgi:hypothetical protein